MTVFLHGQTGGGGVEYIATPDGQHSVPCRVIDAPEPVYTATAADIVEGKTALTKDGVTVGTLLKTAKNIKEVSNGYTIPAEMNKDYCIVLPLDFMWSGGSTPTETSSGYFHLRCEIVGGKVFCGTRCLLIELDEMYTNPIIRGGGNVSSINGGTMTLSRTINLKNSILISYGAFYRSGNSSGIQHGVLNENSIVYSRDSTFGYDGSTDTYVQYQVIELK